MSPSDRPAPTRRRVFAAAGTAGALAAAAAVLPGASRPAGEPAAPAPAAHEPRDSAGGYQLSEHVQRYYRTARV